MVSALSSRLTIDVEDEGGLLGDTSFPSAHCDRSSIGKGNIMVEFFSALIEFRVCKYRSWNIFDISIYIGMGIRLLNR